MEHVERMTDGELVICLREAVARSRRADAEVVALIGEVDARQLYREHACSSTFAFCTERLGMSEGAAFKRIRVARAARDFPDVLEALASGAVHLSGLCVLAPHLSAENVAGVLGRAAGKSKRDIEVLAAELAPKPDVKASLRRAPAPRATQKTSPEQFELPPAPPAKVRPLAPARFHVNFTADDALKRNLDTAKELLGHGVGTEEIFARAMAVYVEQLKKKKFGTGRPAKKACRGRRVSKAVQRQVFERDGGQCTFVDDRGNRCSERHGVQYDHIIPWAAGGRSTVENGRLRCGPHNQLAAERYFGRPFMAAKRKRRAERSPARVARRAEGGRAPAPSGP